MLEVDIYRDDILTFSHVFNALPLGFQFYNPDPRSGRISP